jgi:hypothetical protein
MSGKLITAKIDVTKINKELLFKGQKGTYLDLTIWQNDEPDKYGNDFSIEQRTGKDDKKIYLGNGKFYVPKDKPANNEGVPVKGKITTGAMSDINDLPGANDDSMPF